MGLFDTQNGNWELRGSESYTYGTLMMWIRIPFATHVVLFGFPFVVLAKLPKNHNVILSPFLCIAFLKIFAVFCMSFAFLMHFFCVPFAVLMHFFCIFCPLHFFCLSFAFLLHVLCVSFAFLLRFFFVFLLRFLMCFIGCMVLKERRKHLKSKCMHFLKRIKSAIEMHHKNALKLHKMQIVFHKEMYFPKKIHRKRTSK